MSFQTILNSEVASGAPIDAGLLSKVKNNDDFLNTTNINQDSSLADVLQRLITAETDLTTLKNQSASNIVNLTSLKYLAARYTVNSSFNIASTVEDDGISEYLTVEDTTEASGITIVAKKKCSIDIGSFIRTSHTAGPVNATYITKNGSLISFGKQYCYNGSPDIGTVAVAPLVLKENDVVKIAYAYSYTFVEAGFSLRIQAVVTQENVLTTWSSDRVGETIYSLQSTPPNGFISAMGSILGLSSGTHQGETYKALYKYAWNVASTTAGSPYLISSAKGTSADADWTAGKTITIDERGLFTRAYKSGTSGNVGEKQSDAFQGHGHAVHYYGGSGSLRTILSTSMSGNAYSGLITGPSVEQLALTARQAIDDGVNSTPRTAAETRPVNVAKYVYIRYMTSAPMILALPVSKRNSFEVQFGPDGSVTRTNAAGLITATKTGTGLYTIDYSKLNLKYAPLVRIEEVQGVNLQTNAAPRFRDMISMSTTQINIRTGYNTGSAGTLADLPFSVTIIKAEGDYAQPGVVAGELIGQWQYDISSYVTGFSSISNAKAIIFKTDSGMYKISYKITGTVASASSFTSGITGVTFAPGYNQPAYGVHTDGTPTWVTSVIAGPSNIIAVYCGSAHTTFCIGGDNIDMANLPAWATNTP